MIHSPRFAAILDACVLFPAPIRDYLLHLASLDLFKPQWTHAIQEELVKNLLIKSPDLKRQSLNKTVQAMNAAFPDANVEKYEVLVKALTLPDPNDRHVLAAAIKAKADVIVNFNLKDFPKEFINQFDIEVEHPDEGT